MINFEGNSANELFINICKDLITFGNCADPRGLKTKELQHVWLTLHNPNRNNCIVTLPSRKLNLSYLDAEIKWYLSGDTDITFIKEHSSFWEKLADSNNTINSNYGYLALKQKFNGLSQVEWCIKRLKEDKNTRQAVINYNQPCHKYENNKDFVCTLNQLFRINNNKLDITTLMRSNDLIYGLSYDLPWFILVGSIIAKELNIELGVYRHYAASLHVYEKHFKMIEEIANEKIN